MGLKKVISSGRTKKTDYDWMRDFPYNSRSSSLAFSNTLRRWLWSADRFSDNAILRGSSQVNTPGSRSSALLDSVTCCDQWCGLFWVIRFIICGSIELHTAIIYKMYLLSTTLNIAEQLKIRQFSRS